jgi:hypothetical protein
MIRLETRITLYEIDGRQRRGPERRGPLVRVLQHPDGGQKVILRAGGHEYAVNAEQLALALSQARGV